MAAWWEDSSSVWLRTSICYDSPGLAGESGSVRALVGEARFGADLVRGSIRCHLRRWSSHYVLDWGNSAWWRMGVR